MSRQYDYLVRNGWVRVKYVRKGCMRIARWRKWGFHDIVTQAQAVLIQKGLDKAKEPTR